MAFETLPHNKELSPQDREASTHPNHPWRRLFAFCTDYWIFSAVGYIAVSLLYHATDFSFLAKIAKVSSGGLLSPIFMTLSWLVLSIVVQGTIGTTPGRLLYGIRIKTSLGKKLGFALALRRSAHIWIGALIFGIPIVSLFTIFSAYKTLNRTGLTDWDRICGTFVSHSNWGVLRAIAVLLSTAAALVLASMGFVLAVGVGQLA